MIQLYLSSLKFIAQNFWRVLAARWYVYLVLIGASVGQMAATSSHDPHMYIVSIGLFVSMISTTNILDPSFRVDARDVANIVALYLAFGIVVSVPFWIELFLGRILHSEWIVASGALLLMLIPIVKLLMAVPYYLTANARERSIVGAWRRSWTALSWRPFIACVLMLASIWGLWQVGFRLIYFPMSAALLAYYNTHPSSESFRLIVGIAGMVTYVSAGPMYVAAGIGTVALARLSQPATASGKAPAALQ
jgi:hypothetical protein